MADEEEDPKQNMVPQARFNAVVADKNSALGRVSELEAENAKLLEKSATVDTITTSWQSSQDEVKALKASYAQDLDLAERGFDSDGRGVAKMLHDKLPEEGRPSMGDWIGGFMKDPTKAPKPLQAYFGDADDDIDIDADEEDVDEAEDEGAGRKPLPKAKRKPKGRDRGGATQYDAGALKAMREEAQRTGDYTKFKKANEAAGKALFNRE